MQTLKDEVVSPMFQIELVKNLQNNFAHSIKTLIQIKNQFKNNICSMLDVTINRTKIFKINFIYQNKNINLKKYITFMLP